jgi:hypothetical protein
MSNTSDPLERACLLVGRFLYHFARVEQKIDQAVIKLLASLTVSQILVSVPSGAAWAT